MYNVYNEHFREGGHLNKEGIIVGFGIKKNEDAKAAAMSSDAVIVGSALIEIIEKSNDKSSCLSSLAAFVLGLRKSIDSVVK